MNLIKILIVDDHKIFSDGIISMLGDEKNIEIVSVAENTMDAIKKIESDKPEIILLDISLNKENGLTLLHTINKKYDNVKVIVLSMHNNTEYIYKAFKSGAKGYLTKQHTNKSELIESINLVFEGGTYFNKNITEKIVTYFVEEREIEEKFRTLGSRELEILKLITEGYTNKEIAEKLFINIRTVETHKTNMLTKLELKNFIEVVKYVIKYDIFGDNK